MKRILAVAALCLLCGSVNAALISRLSGQAYYDDVLDVTWLADANYAQTSGYDGNGLMQWGQAQAFVSTVNAANHLGANNWRLPTITDTGTAGCNFTYSGTDCGYNSDPSTSEMAHLFYVTLANEGYYDSAGVPTGCSVAAPQCLTNDGPFANLDDYYYWSANPYAPATTRAWYFGFGVGSQNNNPKTNGYRAFLVRSGDISPVPVPAAVWLFGSALGVMVWMRRKVST